MRGGLRELSMEEPQHPSPLLPDEIRVLKDLPWRHTRPCPSSHPGPQRRSQPSRHIPRDWGELLGQNQPGKRAGNKSWPRGSRRREGCRRGKPEGCAPPPQEPAPRTCHGCQGPHPCFFLEDPYRGMGAEDLFPPRSHLLHFPSPIPPRRRKTAFASQ